MKKTLILFCLALSIFGLAAAVDQPARKAVVLKLSGTIDAIAAQYVTRGIGEAEKQNAECLILQLDTPGGLVTSTQDIVKKILAAKLPVIVYIGPQGAQAASAGALISMSCDLIVMAPGTYLGAAHPIDMGMGSAQSGDSKIKEKFENALSAFSRSIAERTGRDIAIANDIVMKSASFTSQEALNKKIADLIADNIPDILNKIDGTKLSNGKWTLSTKGLQYSFIEMNSRESLLHMLVNPTLAYILLTLGIMALIAEFNHPGAYFPGIFGVIALLLALVSLEALPTNFVGVILIVISMGLFIAELKVGSLGVLFIGGLVCFALGSVLLYRLDAPDVRVHLSVITLMTVLLGGFFLFLITVGLKATRAKVTSGVENIIGQTGITKTEIGPQGVVLVKGEDWSAEPVGSEKIAKGEKIEVVSRQGAVIKVRKV
jgi:membrane-bound serine protease (ClpP class)